MRQILKENTRFRIWTSKKKKKRISRKLFITFFFNEIRFYHEECNTMMGKQREYRTVATYHSSTRHYLKLSIEGECGTWLLIFSVLPTSAFQQDRYFSVLHNGMLWRREITWNYEAKKENVEQMRLCFASLRFFQRYSRCFVIEKKHTNRGF